MLFWKAIALIPIEYSYINRISPYFNRVDLFLMPDCYFFLYEPKGGGGELKKNMGGINNNKKKNR